MTAIHAVSAIDVHGHYGKYDGGAGNRMQDGFYSGGAAEVAHCGERSQYRADDRLAIDGPVATSAWKSGGREY